MMLRKNGERESEKRKPNVGLGRSRTSAWQSTWLWGRGPPPPVGLGFHSRIRAIRGADEVAPERSFVVWEDNSTKMPALRALRNDAGLALNPIFTVVLTLINRNEQKLTQMNMQKISATGLVSGCRLLCRKDGDTAWLVDGVALRLRLPAQRAPWHMASSKHAKDSAAPALRWASEFSQRENCHQPNHNRCFLQSRLQVENRLRSSKAPSETHIKPQ